MNKELIKKFLSFSFGNWVGLVIGLLVTIVTTRLLAPEQFGKASMFTLVLNITMMFIMFGTDQSFIRFFYEEKEENRSILLYKCILITLPIYAVASVFLITFHERVSKFLFEEENLSIILTLLIGIIFQILSRFSMLVIRMKQKGSLYSLILIFQKLINIISVFIFYKLFGASYKIIIFATVMDLITVTVLAIIYERPFWNINNINKSNLENSAKDIINFGFPLLITSLITYLFQSFDKVAIKQWSSFEELGLYAAAFKIVALVSVLQTSFSTFWTPVAFEKFQSNPEEKVFFSNMSKTVSIGMFIVAIFSILGKDLIVYLLGEDYRQASNIMPFLVFMPLMYTISETTVIGINFYKKPRWHIVIASVSCLVNILGNWLLVPQYGAIGASIATAFSFVVFFTLRTFISSMFYKVDYALKKIYYMLMILSAYAFYSIYSTSYFGNVVVGIVNILMLLIIYKNEMNEVKVITNRMFISKIKKFK